MYKHLIFDGPTKSNEKNGREQKLETLTKSANPGAKFEGVTDVADLLKFLAQSEALVCIVHHNELHLAGIQERDCPSHHFYIHYSGAGFETCPEGWQRSDNHVFLADSIDSQGSSALESLHELLKTLRGINPAPPLGHWQAQLKTLNLTTYKSPRQFLYGHFPNWLAQAWRFQNPNTEALRQKFIVWAESQKLSDGSSPGPLTIESAWKIVTAQRSIKETFDIQQGQKQSKIRHDFKYLLFALKDGDKDRFKQLWQSNFVPDLNTWLGQEHLRPQDIGMEAVDNWLKSSSMDFLEGKKLVQHLRDDMDKFVAAPQEKQTVAETKTKIEPSENTPSIDPGTSVNTTHSGTAAEEKFDPQQSKPQPANIPPLPRYQQLPYPPSLHSPRLWCVGPHSHTAALWFKALQGLKAGTRPLNLSQCCYDQHLQLGDLLHQLRHTSPRELFNTLLCIDVGEQLREALNAGRSLNTLSPSASWTHDSQLQLGIVVRLICTFPHMTLAVLHDLNSSELREVLRQELLFTLPPTFMKGEELLEQIIQQHFFNIQEDRPSCAKLCAHFIEGQRNLFDPTGLRTLVKLRLIANIFSSTSDLGQPDLKHTEQQRKVLGSRLEQVMISIDEDASSTLFHAYAGYRYGYRAWTATSFYQFDQAHIWQSVANKHLVIRDTDLRFPDIDGRENVRDGKAQGSVRQRLESVYSDLWQFLPKNSEDVLHTQNSDKSSITKSTLAESSHKKNDSDAPIPKLGQHWKVRTVAATGHPIRNKPWIGASEREIRLGEIQGQSKQAHVLGLNKPLRSLYDLAQLMDWPQGSRPETLASRLTPPARLNSSAGHFAPYINLPLAGELLVQAKSLQGEDEMDWLIGAILAMEADEILLGMSEYTGLDAVRWLHRCEVRAEIRSVGFSGLIHIKPRKKELQCLVHARYRDNSLSQDHFLSRLWDDLRTLYKGAEQFHASEEANVESFCKRKWLGHHRFGHRIEEVLRRVVIMSASSICTWSSCLVLSTLLFWLLYGTCLPHETVFTNMFGYKVFITSLIGEPALGLNDHFPAIYSPWLQFVLILHLSSSYLLFGFFLSMVYRRITRS